MREMETLQPCRLHLEIVSGRNFERKKRQGPCNVSCLLRFCEKPNGHIPQYDKDQLFRTTVQDCSANPTWNETFVFEVASIDHGQVEITLWDSQERSKMPAQAAWIGQIVLNTGPLAKGAGEEQQLELMVRQDRESSTTCRPPVLCVRAKLGFSSGRPRQFQDKTEQSNLSKEMRGFFEQAQEMTIFQNLDRNAVLSLCRRMKTVNFPSNALVFAAGSKGTSMYFVISGECAVVIGGKAVVTLTAGDHFGEIALLVSQRRTADIYTTSESVLLEISREDMLEVLEEYSECATSLYVRLRKISELRVRRFSGEVEQHPSAIHGGDSPLSGKNSVRDRKQRIQAWHDEYSSGQSLRTRSADDCHGMEDDDDQDEAKLMAEAMRVSGVGSKVVAVIRKIKLFQDAPPKALAHVVSKLKVQQFERGETIIEEGTQGRSMFIIDEGSADVLVKGSKVSELLSHSFFGEVALVSSQMRTATVIATGVCRCLRLQQNDLGTVFNMFPSMYKTLSQVADARVHNASSSPETHILTSPQQYRRSATDSRWNVKFRGPLKSLAPELAGACPLSAVYVAVERLQAFFLVEGNDKSHVTLSNGHKVLLRSEELKGARPQWEVGPGQRHKLYCDGSGAMHFALQRSSGSFRRRDHASLGCVLAVGEMAGNRREYALSMTEGGRGGRADKASADSKAKLRVTLDCSPPILQPYQIWSPVQASRVSVLGSGGGTRVGSTDSSGSSSGNSGSIHPVIDRAGHTLMWARWRDVPDEESGRAEDEAAVQNRYVTFIDLATADGAYCGSVVTDVTAKAHARSRLMTSVGVHWATVKTKNHPLDKRKGRAPNSPTRSPQAMLRSQEPPLNRFKVVPIYSEFHIGTTEHATDANGHGAQGFREVALTKRIREGEHVTVGTVRVPGVLSAHTHMRVDVTPQQDMILLVQLALALGESQRLCPAPGGHVLSDAFDKVYQSS